MPNLPPFPRLRRPIAVGASVAPDALEVAEPKVVDVAGLRWIHVENPRLGLPAAAHPDRVDLRDERARPWRERAVLLVDRGRADGDHARLPDDPVPSPGLAVSARWPGPT